MNPARPYEPLGMTTAAWRDVPPVLVPLAALVPSQDHLVLSALWATARGMPNERDVYPHLVAYQGRTWIVDGHHRISVDVCRGETHTLARLIHRG